MEASTCLLSPSKRASFRMQWSEKISQKLSGRKKGPQSEEWKKKRSEALKRYYRSPEGQVRREGCYRSIGGQVRRKGYYRRTGGQVRNGIETHILSYEELRHELNFYGKPHERDSAREGLRDLYGLEIESHKSSTLLAPWHGTWRGSSVGWIVRAAKSDQVRGQQEERIDPTKDLLAVRGAGPQQEDVPFKPQSRGREAEAEAPSGTEVRTGEYRMIGGSD